MDLDPKLEQWANERQVVYLRAVNEHGGIRPAARALGLSHADISRSLTRLKMTAALGGYVPTLGFEGPVPEPLRLKGTSTLTRAGNGDLVWVKTELDEKKLDELRAAARDAFCEDVPELWVPDGPGQAQGDIIPWIQIGDAHIGMLAHASEAGADFDLAAAERELLAAIGQLVDEMPACERCVINDLGDGTHFENWAGVTARSGHILDTSAPLPDVVRVYSRVMRATIELALTKAQVVDVIINQGNHSRTNDIWMPEVIRAAYASSGRVSVLDNRAVFVGYRMGKTMVMTHHGDRCKPQALVSVMSNDFAKDWGETEFRYIDTGHVHHSRSVEIGGAVVESWNILAPNDKHAEELGYRSRRAISMVLRSRTYGEVGRRILPYQELRARLEAAGHKLGARGRAAFVA